MAIESKIILLRRIEQELAGKLTAADLSATLAAVSDQLAAFEVSQPETDNSADDMLAAVLDAKSIEGRSPKTLKRYEYLIRQMLAAVHVSTREITVYHLRKYLGEMKGRGVSDRTLDGVRQVFSSYFGWLHRESLIPANPCANLGAIKCPKKAVEIFSEVEVELMKEACQTPKEKALISFLLSSGCRVGELIGLDRDSVDLQARLCVVHGKGNKDRKVYFDSVTAMLLEAYLKTRADDCPALFLTRLGERYTAGGIRNLLTALGQRSGVQHVHPHRFRRTCATRLIVRGMAIQDVAWILGHDKLETTMHYVRLDDQTIHNNYNRCA